MRAAFPGAERGRPPWPGTFSSRDPQVTALAAGGARGEGSARGEPLGAGERLRGAAGAEAAAGGSASGRAVRVVNGRICCSGCRARFNKAVSLVLLLVSLLLILVLSVINLKHSPLRAASPPP